MATTNTIFTFVPGKTYKVGYKQQSGNNRWYEWEMTAQFLHLGEHDRMYFSGRPAWGTSYLDPQSPIIRAEQVADGVRKRPRRLVGAVEAPHGL